MAHSYAAICFDLFGTLIDDEARAVSGAHEALALLPANRIAIVTSAPRRTALALIARAGLVAPPVVITADDVERGKPSPEPYVLAARRLAVDPSQALVVEDSASGVAAAQAAGMDVAFVLRGRPASICPQADYCVRGLSEIAQFIRPVP
jgi:mannitol-1-/sugar-/sorbitol-6-phosphatase